GEETLRQHGGTLPGNDAVERAVDGNAGAESREGPQLLIRGAASRRGGRHLVGQVRSRVRLQALAAADGLPHLAHLLRARSWSLRLPSAQERRRDELEEVLRLASGESAGDPVPEGPPLGPARRLPGR